MNYLSFIVIFIWMKTNEKLYAYLKDVVATGFVLSENVFLILKSLDDNIFLI